MRKFYGFVCGLGCLACGAVSGAEYTVTTSEDDGSDGSLRALVENAKGGDTIYMPSSLSPIKLASEIYFNQKMLHYIGTGDGRTVIKATNSNRLFVSGKNASDHLVFENIEFRDGDARNATDPANQSAAKKGGALFVRDGIAYVDFLNCSFVNNRANEGGALFFIKTAYVTLTDCTFTGNDAEATAGAIMLNNRVKLGLTNCVFTANTALSSGAIGGPYGDLVIKKCEFRDNVATNTAGAYCVNNSTVLAEDTVFSGNRCLVTGNVGGAGAVGAGNNDAFSIYRDCVFTNNISYNTHGGSNDGGACGASNATNLFERCTFVDNHRPNSGGGAICTRTDVEFRDCVFRNNSCGNGGGGALWQYNGKLDIVNCIFEGNSANDPNNYSCGGAMYHRSSSEMLISNTIFRANKAINPNQGYAGAIGEYSDNHHSTVIDCLFENNSAYRNASAFQTAFSIDFVNCVFKDNVCREGSALYFSSGTQDRPLNLVNCTFVGNESGEDEVDATTGVTTVRNGYGAVFIACNGHTSDVVRVNHCTFVNNTSDGAALHLNNAWTSPIAVSNSVFRGNRDWKGTVRDMYSNFASIDATVTEQEYGTKTDAFKMTATDSTGNHFGDELALGDLKLDTELADNDTKKTFHDGSHLQTLAIGKHSPLRGAAIADAGVTTDARGVARDAQPDIGAFEFSPLKMFFISVR